ncbi:MAG: hypothetical protein L3J65_05715 [Robiginitomaculum sp.]|nr:hypothetical protein [Robiginitomaculum sp.]
MIKFTYNLVLMGGLALANPAYAQVSFGNDGPIDVKAERATYRGSKTILSGNVRVKQKDGTILADRMDLFRTETTTPSQGNEGSFIKLGNINRIVAVGNFRYITTENRVTGDKGVYERDKEIITVTGNARFVQNNGSTITGNKMIYDLNTNRAKIAGNCTGRECERNDRVEIKFGGKE